MNPPRSKVGERGQVTIPKRFRRSLGIRAGEDVEFEEREGALVLRRIGTSDPLDHLVGVLDQRVDVDAYLAESRGPGWSATHDAEKPRPRRAGKRRR